MNQNNMIESSFGRSNSLPSGMNVHPVLRRGGGQNAVVSETIGWSMGLYCIRPFSSFKLSSIILY